MGGSAFAQDGLYTPRMPEAVYRSMLEQVESRYKKYFRHVAHPIEAPGKSTYGDIDVLIAEPVDPTRTVDSMTTVFLAEIVGGKRATKTSGSSTTSIAINWPREFAGEIPLETTESTSGLSTNLNAAWIQVDVQICSTVDVMNWTLFLHAHGDLWNMLGGIIRRFGLTSTPKGFFLRIEEAERYSKEQSRVKLTTDPNQVLQYLGLDLERYWQPFTTLDQMMSYAATCRFHNPNRWEEKKREALKANDRQRANKRPAFAYWTDTFLPEHANDAPGAAAHLTRDEVVEDAKRFFGEELSSSFNERKEILVRQTGVNELWATIRKSITAEGAIVTYAMKGLKAAIASPDGGDFDFEGDLDLQDQICGVRSAYAKGHFDEVREWGVANWEDMGKRQERLDKAKSRQNLLKKIQRDAMPVEEG
ncbi:uncharacterized protein A1O9_01166 [Exophiala aquamarina CBS 119918]|uniref:Uncharacterized protein n=1 Tax=Exophiala aquamarina CBS 119918 TaxID=1182545 RepID=A0A072PSW6_9EURO|nr:uncharacterized protein A1O9_01166 [Exophiala aquamarina CBS 119918]KEF63189.1 hypothetical protein A1O9_01166 [Exophiala aquamarina CBS 119918]